MDMTKCVLFAYCSGILKKYKILRWKFKVCILKWNVACLKVSIKIIKASCGFWDAEQSRAVTCWKAWTKDCKFSLRVKARGTEYRNEVWIPVTYRFIMSLSFSQENTGNFIEKCSVLVDKISYVVAISFKKWLFCSRLLPETSLKGHYRSCGMWEYWWSTKNTATMISDSFYADCGKKMVEDNESLAL